MNNNRLNIVTLGNGKQSFTAINKKNV